MQDFLIDINKQVLQERLKKLKLKIEQEKKLILNKINKILEQNSFNINNDTIIIIQKQHPTIDSYNNVEAKYEQKNLIEKKNAQNKKQYLIKFYQACTNIINIYFPLLMEQPFLQLQSQQEIQSKIMNLSNVINKTIISFMKRLNKQIFYHTQENQLINQQNKGQSLVTPINLKKTKLIKKINKKEQQNSLQLKQKGKNSKISANQSYVMQKWLIQNFQDPYPSQLKKQQMADQAGLSVQQVNNWLINARQRVIKKFMKKSKNYSSSFSKNIDQSSPSSIPIKKLKKQKN